MRRRSYMIKSKIKNIIVLGICFAALASTASLGAEDIKTIKEKSIVPITYHENQITKEDKNVAIQIDDQWIKLKAEPFIEKGHTLMPIFEVADALDVEVEWDDKKGILKINTLNTTIELDINKDIAKIIKNTEGTPEEGTIRLDVKPKIVDDDIFVPGRFIAETLGDDVDWDNSLRAMIIRTKSIVYINSKYNFEFKLPESWKGYTIVNDEWLGNYMNQSQDDDHEIGPMISIRYPQWTAENPRQDIPIMVFTIDQWNLVQNEKLGVGAAPIPPKELGRNNKYVFALPARYNFSFLLGYEEVEDILENEPLKPIE
jgi:hypothetical protein